MKRAEDGNGIIVRLYESQRRRGVLTLSAGFGLAEAWHTNLLEENETSLEPSDNTVRLSSPALRDRYPAIGAGVNSRIRLTSRFCSEPRSRQVPIVVALRRPTHRSARLVALSPSPTRSSAGLQPGL